MKISGKFILKVAGTLTIISLVVALLLGLVNGVTADKIAAMNAAATQTALEAVTEAGSTYDEITSIPQEVMDAAKEMGGTLEEMYTVTFDGQPAGYAVKLTASGSQGLIEMVIGVDAEQKITGISVVSHSETSGIGTKVCGNMPNDDGVPVLDQFWHERRRHSEGGQNRHRHLRRHRFHQGRDQGRQRSAGRCGRSGLREEELRYEFR